MTNKQFEAWMIEVDRILEERTEGFSTMDFTDRPFMDSFLAGMSAVEFVDDEFGSTLEEIFIRDILG